MDEKSDFEEGICRWCKLRITRSPGFDKWAYRKDAETDFALEWDRLICENAPEDSLGYSWHEPELV